MDSDQGSRILVPVILLSEGSCGSPKVTVKEGSFCTNDPNSFRQLVHFVSSQPELKNEVCSKFDMKGKSMLPLPNNMPPGSKLIVEGTPLKNNPEGFAIDLVSDKDIALHLNPRFVQKVFVQNSLVNNKWGTEYRHGPLLFAPGVPFNLQIDSQDKGFKIILNGISKTFFEHRLNPEAICVLRIRGDVIIGEITYVTPNTSNLMKDLSFRYIDMDNDMIPVESQAEFVECLKECKLLQSIGKKPAVHVCEKGKDEESFWSTVDYVNKALSVNVEVKDCNLNRPPEMENQLKNHLSINSEEVPSWFTTEMQKFKNEIIESMEAKVFSEMSSVLENFAKELHHALDKVTKEDDGKKSKKSKDKKKAEKKEKAERKEKAKLLSNASSVSKPVKDKQGKLAQAAGAFNMRLVDACISKMEKQNACREHLSQSQKRTSLNEEKRNKLYAAAKRKKDSPLKYERRPLTMNQGKSNSNIEVKNKVHLSLDKEEDIGAPTSFRKNDADRIHLKSKLFDTFGNLSPSSSDSDHREGLEESDDIVVVGFSSSFDEISDSDLSLENIEGAEVSGKESTVDVVLPTCFIPEVPIAFKGTLPLRLKRTDIEELKSKTCGKSVSSAPKKSRSKAKESDNNAFMVDEKGICHSINDAIEQDFKEMEDDLKEWQIIVNSSLSSDSPKSQASDNKETSADESKTKATLKAPTCLTDRSHRSQKRNRVEYSPDFSKLIEKDLKRYESFKNNVLNAPCLGYMPKSTAYSDKTGTDEKYEENTDAGKSNLDLRYVSAGPKMTVSERLQSREPPHSDNASERLQSKEPPHSDNTKERKRKKEADFEAFMDIMYRLCKNPPNGSVPLKTDSTGANEFECGRSSDSNCARTDPKFVKQNQNLTSSSEKKCIPSDFDDQFLLKSLHSSDDSSSSDYEECEETSKPKNSGENERNADKNCTKISEPSEVIGNSVLSSHLIEIQSKMDTSAANNVAISVESTKEVKKDNSSGKVAFCPAGKDNATQVTEVPRTTTVSFGKDNATQATEATARTTALNFSDANKHKDTSYFDIRSFNGCPKFSFSTLNANPQSPPEATLIDIKNTSDVAAGIDFDLLKSTKPMANHASHDSGASSYFNTSKKVTYPPQQVHQSGTSLNTSTPYNPFTAGPPAGPPYFSDLLHGQNGYPYVPYMPLPKNFSCSQSFQSSQSAQNLIPKPAVPPPPPPPIVIPPALPQDKHFYFHQPAYNTLYTNSVNPYYTNPQFNAFLNKGDPLKNCAPLKRDPTYTTPVMGHMYPSVYPIYYPPSTVPLNNTQSNWTTVMPPAATPAANFVQTPSQAAGQPSNNLLQNRTPVNDKLTPDASLFKKKLFSSDAATSGNETSAAATSASCQEEPLITYAGASESQTATLSATSSMSEASASGAAPCGIEVSTPENGAKAPARLNLADFITERLFSTLNSAASNVKEAFAPSRTSSEKKDETDALFGKKEIFPEFLNAFFQKEPIQIHILHQSTRQRFFVMPHKNLGQSHTLHCDLKSHMISERPCALTDSDLRSGVICALHENLHLSKENKDTWSRVKILSAEGTLVRAQKLDFGVIVHCDSQNLKELPTKFKSMPALAAQVIFSGQEGPTETMLSEMNPLYVQPLQYFPEDDYWLVKVCENFQESLVSDSATASASSVPPSNTDSSRNERSTAASYFSSVEGTAAAFEDATSDDGGETAAYEQLDHSLEDKVKFLQDIGFKGETNLKNLLINHNGDMSDVIDILTSNNGYFFAPPEADWL